MADTQNELDLKAARQACVFASDMRGYHRRRTEKANPQRKEDLKEARKRLHSAMKPIRAYLGKIQFTESTEKRRVLDERYRKASHALQMERRRLWKMQQKAPRKRARKSSAKGVPK